MMQVLEFEKDKVKPVSFQEMRFHAVKWIDVFEPSMDEFKKVAKLCNIPLQDLLRIQKDVRSDVYEYEHFSCVFFKQAFHKGFSFRAKAMLIISSPNLIITLRLHDKDLFEGLFSERNDHLKSAFVKGSSALLNIILERITHRYFDLMDLIEDKIDRVENEVLSNLKEGTTKHIFELKKGLIYFHRALSSNRELLNKLEKGTGSQINERHLKNLRYTYADTVQLIDIAATYREVLVSAIDIYLTNASNNMNLVMKRMTALGSLVLVPTLITGIYGMNFKYMPEITWPYGYAFAWFLIISSVVVLWTYFKQKDWL
ncbi:hypothetical protein D6783_03670 [Candidatus Woesearchaeota archaeon]|nr:MAG: hypothetical protein D6783_03670 [Candidatus Woesearchaeota archaeon]